MKPEVFFIPASSEEDLSSIHKKITKLYNDADLNSCFDQGDLVAVKTHFGEGGNVTHIPATYFKPIITGIKKNKGKPFLTDTCVLYRSQRSDAIVHLQLAQDHGFSLTKCGAPVIIADGLRGRNEIEVEIPGKIFSKVAIASEAIIANSMFV